MGRITVFDHFKTSEDLDIATQDSCPLDFLEDQVSAQADEQKAYARQEIQIFKPFIMIYIARLGRPASR